MKKYFLSPLRLILEVNFGIFFLQVGLQVGTKPALATPAPVETLQNLCAKTAGAQASDSDRPSQEEKKVLNNCNSVAAYYGDGEAVDYRKARLCAFYQYEEKVKSLFGGATILMQLYANGEGVDRNLDFAIRLACEQKDAVAPVEFEGRLKHLDELSKNKKIASGRFDICDDVTSGSMQGACATRDDEFEKNKREADFREKVVAKFNSKEMAAYYRLKKASDHFVEARSNSEIDLSGTARAAFVSAEKTIQQKDFIQSLQATEARKDNRYNSAQFKQADRELNQVYQKVLSQTDTSVWGTVTKDQIKETQRVWLKYRDAWVEFAKVRYSDVPGNSIAAWFTKKRTHMLKDFLTRS